MNAFSSAVTNTSQKLLRIEKKLRLIVSNAHITNANFTTLAKHIQTLDNVARSLTKTIANGLETFTYNISSAMDICKTVRTETLQKLLTFEQVLHANLVPSHNQDKGSILLYFNVTNLD